jgi:hypothetical protein
MNNLLKSDDFPKALLEKTTWRLPHQWKRVYEEPAITASDDWKTKFGKGLSYSLGYPTKFRVAYAQFLKDNHTFDINTHTIETQTHGNG